VCCRVAWHHLQGTFRLVPTTTATPDFTIFCFVFTALVLPLLNWHPLQGTIRLVDAAKARGVSTFVLLSSLLTNAAAVGQKDNPNYKLLNLLGGVLDHKLVSCLLSQQEMRSGCTWSSAFYVVKSFCCSSCSSD
jgi:hypothetical protein